MKSKITKIQILKKGMVSLLVMMFMLTPIAYAATTLSESTFLEQLLYGTIGSTVKEIEEHFTTNTTLYISNETQLRALAEYVNSRKNPCIGKEIVLLNDINLDSSIEWTPIGNTSVYFKGIFDGRGHTIRGVTYSNNGLLINKKFNYIGLFGIIGKEGIVKNLIVEDFNIDLHEGLEGSYVGNIAGENRGTISNCINRSDISGMDYVGGIVGRTYKESQDVKIENCINNGDVEGYNYVGGIVGGTSNTGKVEITNCRNTGNIKGNQTIGGIVGSTEISHSTIKKCTNIGSVEGTQHIGGIAGYSSDPWVQECINDGEIKATNGYVGGIIGRINSNNDKYLDIQQCINNGNVISDSKYIGGIVGFLTGKANSRDIFNVRKIRWCKNTGTIRSYRCRSCSRNIRYFKKW